VLHHLQEDLVFKSLVPLPAARLAAIRADQRFRRNEIESLGEPVLAAAMVGAQRTGNVSYFSTTTGRDEIAGFAPVTAHDWVVGVTESRADFEAPLGGLYRQLLWSVVLVGLLFTGLALRFARGIVQPIRNLTQAANALKAGDFDHAEVQVGRRDEIGQLARTFSVMIDVLRQRERERGNGSGSGSKGR
jgi:HAMP domain-containing protein